MPTPRRKPASDSRSMTDARVSRPACWAQADPKRDRGREVDIKVTEGSLRIRSSRAASRYVGADAPALTDADGFIDTGDLVELRGGRCYFVGRRGGIINVGGLKVHPEEVEAVINRHPQVQASLVRSRRNLITGAIVVADVVLRTQTDGAGAGDRTAAVKRDILAACRQALANYKVPAAIRFVAALEVAATGKSVRHPAPHRSHARPQRRARPPIVLGLKSGIDPAGTPSAAGLVGSALTILTPTAATAAVAPRAGTLLAASIVDAIDCSDLAQLRCARSSEAATTSRSKPAMNSPTPPSFPELTQSGFCGGGRPSRGPPSWARSCSRILR